ncbi:serine protease sp-Eoc49 isoform X1 [Plutella xylostella]|uniref:serine protease sp-Eoc49 isoform X1 n=1 Tax=Plutella xylostella TaxID=51655 RepID=UPI002032990B|nr:serine protease sp-Eoc49 isoform X1 [Plutella xylostella]
MLINVLVPVCFVLYSCESISGERTPAENEVKRGQYPYMAFLYYPDDTIVDTAGNRFIQDAVLLKPDWLVSAAIDPMEANDVAVGFPAKTLLARAGAVTIDANITLNEDENEQEREVIRIVRPANHDMYKYWLTDVSLLKTLEAFKETPAVAPAALATTSYTDKVCTILVFTKQSTNTSTDKVLTHLSVEMLSPSAATCGAEYAEKTMTCASDPADTSVPADYCHGNEGGPLICDNLVVGLQTYLNNQCKPPHLFQLLSGWSSFTTCGTEGKCSEEYCSQICRETLKDEPRVTSPLGGSTRLYNDLDAEVDSKDNSTAANTTVDAHASSHDNETESTDADATTTENSTDADATSEGGSTVHPDHFEHSPGNETSDIEVSNSTDPAETERRVMNKTEVERSVRYSPHIHRRQTGSAPKQNPVAISAELVIVIANLLLAV